MILRGRLRALLLLLPLALALGAQDPAQLRVAVLAYRPKAQVQARWGPMARYLTARLGQPVAIDAYDFQEMNAAISRNEVDAVITNPGHYILLKQGNVMSAPLVTLVARVEGQSLSALGGVIFVRAEDTRLQGLRDLAGKRIASVGMESLGGYQMQAYELMEAGVPPPTGDRLLSLGMPHDLAVQAVLSGRADAGFVRTGLLESLAREGALDLGRVRILNRQDLGTFPLLASTRLYPEWPVAVFPQVSPHLADRLAIALLSLERGSEAAEAAGLAGFTIPADYGGVEAMLRRLKVPPFNRSPEFTLADLWGRYASWILALGGMVAVLVGLTLRLVVQNRVIQQAEARSSLILDNLDAYIYLKDLKGRYRFANASVLRLWGKSLPEVVGRGDGDFFDAETTTRIREVDRAVLEEGRTVRAEETNRVTATGAVRTYLSTKLPLRHPDGRVYALCGISTDITERKQTEEIRSYLAAIVESSEDAIASKSLDGLITSWNQAAVRMFGYSEEEALGQPIRILLPPDREAEEAGILVRVQAGESVRHLETLRLRKDGQPIHVALTVSPIRNTEGRIIGASEVMRDITERKRSEQALREALAFSDQIISSAQESITVYDLEGRVVRINRYLEELSGFTTEEIRGRHFQDLFLSTPDQGRSESLRKALAGQRVVLPPFEWSFPRTGRSGWATAVQGPLLGARGEIIGAISVATDITEIRRSEALQRQLQEDLQQTQKLESLGSLAGGIAHDMNNVLAAIQAISQTLKQAHGAEPRLAEALDTIERASTRGRDLVRGLTNFARKDLREAEALDINALVGEEMDILRRTTLQRVDLVLDLDPARPYVQGERSSLASALMNLCVNAVDAMPGGGTLTLRTRCPDATRVEIEVEDSGQGMPPEVLSRALEPFYTTKPVGKGTGLGLAMVYTTAKAHGGAVHLRSEPGRGTCVRLELPRIPAPGAGAGEGGKAAAPTRGLRILQVDDDELILGSVPGLLEVMGHEVFTACGGEEALSRLREGLAVDLVILDLNMPGMNGEETLREIRKAWPSLPVLMATGFLDPRTAAVLTEDGHARSITKPFSMEDLGAKILEIASLDA